MLTPEEQKIVDFGVKKGKKSKEILGALSKFRAENKPVEVKPIFDAPVKPKSTLADVPSDIMDFGAGVKSVVGSAGDRQKGILDAYATGEQGFLRTVGQSSANLASAVSGVAGEGLKLVAKLFASPEAEDFYANAAKTAGEKVLSAPVAVKLIKDYEEVKKTDPVAARDAVALAQGGEFLLNFLGLKAAEKIGDFTLKAGEKTLATGLKTGEQVVTKADDIIRQTDEVLTQEAKQALPPLPPDATPAMIRARAELEKPTMTLSEKWIGLQPDIKKQIAQNPEKLSQYIDVVKARNADVNLPTAYEIGGNEARRATAEMQKVLNETGGEIGQTRQRLGNIRYNQPQIKEIEATFLKELEKLNLAVKNGQVVQKAGALSRVGAKSDIRIANDLYREFLKFKQNPNLTNGIDLRNAFDSKINFAKSAGEASTAIDPLSRQTRRIIADSSAQLVGKTEAKKLADYTQFMEAFNDIKSYTDRAAGGEYLLRLVLSGRGGEARQIIETIRKYTGINLMDDAVMMTTVTDMLGNQTQKTLFSQQVTSAGLDVAKILSGNPQGAIPLLTKFLQQKLVDTEGVLKGAAGIKPEPLKIPTVNEVSDKLKGQRGFISAGYVDEGALTTKILSKLEGKQTVSRQFIEDLTNSGDVRQAERDLIRKVLNESSDSSPLAAEARKYKSAEEFVTAFSSPDKYFEILPKSYLKTPTKLYRGEQAMTGLGTGSGAEGFGLYTTTNKKIANSYAKLSENGVLKEMPLSSAPQNPLYFRGPAEVQSYIQRVAKNMGMRVSEFNEKIGINKLVSSMGYDGVAFQHGSDYGTAFVKFPEKDLVNKSQLTDLWNKANKGDINVSEFANKVKTELLPLKSTPLRTINESTRYENITLPDELRGPVANYEERIYQSPIKTSAGDVHFSDIPMGGGGTSKIDNYFAHTRIEDLPDIKTKSKLLEASDKPLTDAEFEALKRSEKAESGSTRRVIEIQSDLFQKGRLDTEVEAKAMSGSGAKIGEVVPKYSDRIAEAKREVTKLEPYRNTWHERIIREEIKQAALDGKTKLQFPTGETAMKIEGLGGAGDDINWKMADQDTKLTPDKLKVGEEVFDRGGRGSNWIITDVLGDGKFKAIPKRVIENSYPDQTANAAVKSYFLEDDAYRASFPDVETFDISGKVDTNNPIYKFYEKDVQKFLNKFGGKKVVDAQGVSWIEVPITKEMGKSPVQAFGKTSVGALQTMAGVTGALAAAPLIAGAIQKVAQGLDARKEAMDIVSSQIGSGSTMGNDAYNEAVGIVKYLLQNGNAQELEKFISDQQIKMNE